MLSPNWALARSLGGRVAAMAAPAIRLTCEPAESRLQGLSARCLIKAVRMASL